MNTGQIDHCFPGADLRLKVFAQAPIPAPPAECPFHHPPAGDHYKAFGVRGPTGNLQAPPTRLLDPSHDGFIAPIGPDELQAAPPVVDTPLDVRKEFPQEHFATRTVRDTSTRPHYQYEQPQDVYYHRPFAAIHLLVHLRSSLFPAFGRLHALTVDNGRTGLGLPPCRLPHGGDHCGVELVPQAPVAPAPVIPLSRLPCRKVVGQQAPRLPTAHEIKDGIEKLAVCPGARRPRALVGSANKGARRLHCLSFSSVGYARRGWGSIPQGYPLHFQNAL